MDPSPLKIRKPLSKDYILVYKSRSGRYSLRAVGIANYRSAKLNKHRHNTGGALGAWRFTRQFKRGEILESDYVRLLTSELLQKFRVEIKDKLIQMNVVTDSGAPLFSCLKPNQHKTFYNFLTTLK